MLVKQIMARKASAHLVTVTPKVLIHEAACILAEKRIGALIVSHTGTDLLGILSERDIVRELGRRGSGCLQDTVASIMTSNIKTTLSSASAEEVLTAMTEGRFRHMPVMAGDEIIGMVSLGDMVAARLDEIKHENDAMQSMIMGH